VSKGYYHVVDCFYKTREETKFEFKTEGLLKIAVDKRDFKMVKVLLSLENEDILKQLSEVVDHKTILTIILEFNDPQFTRLIVEKLPRALP